VRRRVWRESEKHQFQAGACTGGVRNLSIEEIILEQWQPLSHSITSNSVRLGITQQDNNACAQGRDRRFPTE
jgi:hypothetical protein